MDLNEDWVLERLPLRPKEAHKGTFGKVLVIAGSKQYPGAAYLACAAAYRVGAGLVTLATDNSVKIILSKKLPELTFLSFNEVFEDIGNYDVLLIGPGLGQDSQVAKLVEGLCTNHSNNRYKKVIDAEGLNILSKIGKWWEGIGKDVVLTPHPGEMARLTGLPIKKIQADRTNVAQYFARKWGSIVVLKGAGTVIASSTEVFINPFANPLLATAGTGDVLAGVISGMLAQGLKPMVAAAVGVYIHGMAGKVLQKKIGNSGALASDLLPILPQVIKNLTLKFK